MGQVEKFYPANAADSADNVLEQAVGEFEDVVVIGRSESGDIQVRVTNNLNDAEINLLLDFVKYMIIEATI